MITSYDFQEIIFYTYISSVISHALLTCEPSLLAYMFYQIYYFYLYPRERFEIDSPIILIQIKYYLKCPRIEKLNGNKKL